MFRTPGGFQYACGGWRAGWQAHVADLDGNGLSDVFLYDAASGIFVGATSVGDGTGGFNPQ